MSFVFPSSASSPSSLPGGHATLPAPPDAAPGSAEGLPGQAKLLQGEKHTGRSSETVTPKDLNQR